MFCAMLCDFRVPSSSMSARPASLGLLLSLTAVADDDEVLPTTSLFFAESVSSMVASVEKSCDEQHLLLLHW